MTAETAEQKLARYECVLDIQMREIDKLRAEVERLLDWIMGDADAHTCLQAVYNDPQAPQGNRVKAAAAALPFEKPKLGSTEPPVIRLNVVPLPELLAQRRARQEQLEGKTLDLLPIPNRSNGNGGD
jgi:hypothetical protein